MGFTHWTNLQGKSTLASRLLLVVHAYLFLNFLLLCPIAFYNSSMFWNCDYTSNLLHARTLSGQSAQCWTFASVTDMSGVMAILGLFVIALQVFFCASWMLISADINPIGSKLSVFSNPSPVTGVFDVALSAGFILLMEALPGSNYQYTADVIVPVRVIRILLYGVFNIFSLLLFFKVMPFYKQVANSLLVAFIASRLVVCLTNTVSTFAVRFTVKLSGYQTNRVLIDSLIVAAEAALPLIGFLIAFFVTHLVQSIRIRRVTKLLERASKSDSNFEQTEDILASVSYKEISTVGMLLMGKSRNPESRSRQLLDMLFVATSNKAADKRKDMQLLLRNQGISEAYITNNVIHSFQIGMQALRTCGWKDKLDVYYRCCCAAVLPQVREFVLASQLKKIDYVQIGIQIATKQFFAAMMDLNSEKADKAQAMRTLDILADQLQALRGDAEQRWHFVSRNYGNDPAVLRARASFLLSVENKPDEAEMLLEQAEQVQVSLVQKPRTSSKPSITVRLSKAGRRVAPLASTPESAPGNGEAKPVSSPDTRESFDMERDHTDTSNIDSEDLDAFEEAEMSAEVERSRHVMMVQQIAKPEQHYGINVFFVLSTVVSIATLAAIFVLSRSYQNRVFLSTRVQDTCMLGDAMYAITSRLRFAALDNTYNISGASNDLSISTAYRILLKAAARLETFDEVHVKKIKTRLNSWMDPNGVLDDSSWTDNNIVIRLPNSLVDYTNVTPSANLTLFTNQNSSAVDVLRLVNQYVKEFASTAFLKNLTNSNQDWLNNQKLMFLFANNRVFNMFLQDECNSSIDEYQANARSALTEFFSILTAILVVKAGCYISSFLVMFTFIKRRKKLLQLFATQLPSTIMASLYRQADDRIKAASKVHRVDVEQSRRYAHIGKRGSFSQSVFSFDFWLNVLGCASLLIEVAFVIATVAIFVQWFIVEYQESIVLRPVAIMKRHTGRIGFTMGEYFFDDNPLFLSVDMFGSTHPILPVSLTVQSHLGASKSSIDSVIQARKSVMFHDTSINTPPFDLWNGFATYDGPSATTIKALVDVGSCPPGSNTSILATALPNTLAGDASVVTTTCVNGLSQQFGVMLQDLPVLFAAYKSGLEDASNKVNQKLKQLYYQQFINAHTILFSFDYIMDSYFQDTSANELRLSRLYTMLFGVMLICFVFVVVPMQFLNFYLLYRDHGTRKLLQLVPSKIIEESEELKNYVQQYKLPVVNYLDSRRRSKRTTKDSRTRSILQACADGIFLLDDRGNIVEMNASACRILATTVVQCLGTKFDRFVSSAEDKKKLQQVTQSLSGSTVLVPFGNNEAKSFKKKNQVHPVVDEESTTASISTTTTTVMTTVEREMTLVACDGTQLPARLSCSGGMHDGKYVTTIFIRDITLEKKQKELIQLEKQHSDSLLLNVLPQKIAIRLKAGEKTIADLYEDCTVLFSDMVQFTRMSHALSPVQLIEILNAVVSSFDDAASAWGIEKIKTIGDAYFAIAGLYDKGMLVQNQDGTQRRVEHPEQMCRFALDMMRLLQEYNINRRPANVPLIQIRIGIHTGAVTGGIIGKSKYMFDCFGDTVNTASRMESTSLDGKVQVSRQTYERVYDLFKWTERPGVQCKGLGEVTTYLLEGDVANGNGNGIVPPVEVETRVQLPLLSSTSQQNRNRYSAESSSVDVTYSSMDSDASLIEK